MMPLQKIVEIMRDTAGELPDGLHLLTLPQRLLDLQKLGGALLHPLLERQIELRQGLCGCARLLLARSQGLRPPRVAR